MTSAAPPNTTQTAPLQRPGRSWLWALGALVVVALVWGGTYAAHRVVAARTLAAAHTSTPRYPPATLLSVLRPEDGARFIVPLGDSGKFVLLAGPREQSCPPSGACSAASPLDTLLVMDASTGATLTQVPLSGPSVQPVALAVDASRGLADVISASAVDVYATSSGAHLGTYPLPTGAVADASTRALVTADGTLLVSARVAGVPALVALDAKTGAPGNAVIWKSGSFSVADGAGTPTGATNAGASTLSATSASGPVYDAASGFLAQAAIYHVDNADQTVLYILNASNGFASGVPLAAWALPPGTRPGPVDAASHMLFLFEPGGITAAATEAALEGQPSPASSTTAPAAPLTPQPALAGARALGWDHTNNRIYLADAAGLRILDAAGKTLEALPLPVAQASEQPLAVDEQHGSVYVPTDHGALASVQDASTSGGPAKAHGLNATTATLLARAAVAVLPPQNGQNPPFLTPATFTVGPGSRSLNFYAYDADFGTNGPYPGTATLAVTPVAGQSSVYNVSFAITWNLRFPHMRSWIYQVAADGSVRLVSQAGDGLPCCQTPGQTSG